jgi:hypothetical protein
LNLKSPYLYFFLLGVVYLIFPTQNANIDSWYYASCVKFNSELFNSHHLLFNVINSGIHKSVTLLFPNIEAIETLKTVNAVCAGFGLVLTYKIVLKLNNNNRTAMILSLFCGASFGFMRFATDAETYILPIFFSLLSTYFIIGKPSNWRFLVSGLLAAVSVLLHQIQIWWTLSMIVYLIIHAKTYKVGVLVYVSTLFLIPISYYLVFSFYSDSNSFITYIIGEYGKGNANLDFSIPILKLTLINTFRTFIQVHGYMIHVLENYTILSVISSILILFSGVIFLFKAKIQFIKFKQKERLLFILAILLHLIFAALSSGNAEFMVMLPFLLVFALSSIYKISFSKFGMFGILALFLYNFSFGILPAHLLNLNKMDAQKSLTIGNPKVYFLWEQKPLVENKVQFETQFDIKRNYIDANEDYLKTIDSLILTEDQILTDFGNPTSKYSRIQMSEKQSKSDLTSRYKLLPIDSFDNIYGKNYIYLIQGKK